MSSLALVLAVGVIAVTDWTARFLMVVVVASMVPLLFYKVCMCVYMHVCMYVYMHVCMYVYMCVCICRCIYIFIYR
jgi:hypothetical protein